MKKTSIGLSALLLGVFAGTCFPFLSLKAGEIAAKKDKSKIFQKAKDASFVPSSWKLGKAWREESGLGRLGGKVIVWEKRESGGCATGYFPVRPGAVYRYSAWTKVDKGIKGEMPRLSMIWQDAKGRRIGTSKAFPVVDNDSNTHGWTRLEGVSQIIPREAVRAGLVCLISGKSIERALYGEFSIVPTSTDPVEYLQCSAYKNTFSNEDGEIRFGALLNLNVVLRELRDYSCEVEFRNASGRKEVRTFKPTSAQELEFAIPANVFASGRQDVALRVLVDGRVAGEKLRSVMKTEKPVMRRVMIDRHGRTILDGKPFFPMGMFTGSMSECDYRTYSEAPFNFVMQYGPVGTKELDEYAKIGVYVAIDARALIYGYDYSAVSPYKTLEESKMAFREKFAEIGRHPAFLSWCLVDECPMSLFKNVAAANEFLHELDPDHPTYAVTDKPFLVRPMMPCFDVLGIDPYPIGNRGERADISICSGWVREATKGMFAMRPMWHVPQAFDWGWFRKEDASLPNVRMPTRQELANMTWQGIAAGANGVCSFSFKHLQKKLKGEERRRAWEDVISVAREVKSFEKVLLSAGSPIAVGEVPDALQVRTYDCEGTHWALVANRTCKPVKAMVVLPHGLERLTVVAGKGVSLNGGNLAVDMQGLDYAFVRFGSKGGVCNGCR